MQADAAPLGGLLVVCAIMFLGALGSGALPFVINIRESRLQTASALGGGLLIGSALAVVIPEGFHSFAEPTEIAAPFFWAGSLPPQAGARPESAAADHDHLHDHAGEHHHGVPHGLTGLALVAGFLAMLLLDQLQAAAGGHHHLHRHHSGEGSSAKPGAKERRAPSSPGQAGARPLELSHHPAAADFESLSPASARSSSALAAAAAAAAQIKGAVAASSAAPDRAIAGLLIHCAADGLAMGAAALSGNAALSLVVGTAMVLHKAPMAFGLSTYLMSCQWAWVRAQRTLIVFSAAAPASALGTYALLGAVPAFTTPPAVALAMLFSGGTFLYAATMHILPEVLASGGCGQGSGMSRDQLAAVALGCVLPGALSWGHSH